MKAGLLHCRVEDRSQPWASRGNGLELQNDGGTAAARPHECHTQGCGLSGGCDVALLPTCLGLLISVKSLPVLETEVIVADWEL